MIFLFLLSCFSDSLFASNSTHEDLFQNINEKIRQEIKAASVQSLPELDSLTTDILTIYREEGAFNHIDYTRRDRTVWPPLQHLDNILQMSLAYTTEGSLYFENQTLQDKIEKALAYWHAENPRSDNWWQNEIGAPQRMGKILLVLEKGKKRLPADLLDKLLNRMAFENGDPKRQAGANKVDVALHFMYRACLTKDTTLLKEALTEIYSPLSYTMREGIQYDNSYMQHGPQLYIGGYGTAMIKGVVDIAILFVDTAYALAGERLFVLSKFVRETFLPTIRGESMSYNVLGRGVTRLNALSQRELIPLLEKLSVIDAAHNEEYLQAIARIGNSEQPGYHLIPFNRHYYRSDYTLHQREKYTFDIRTVSNRTARNEQGIGNGEGFKQYFLSDGANSIQVTGHEYTDIFPVWNWAKIPGVTSPELIEIPIAPSYITKGTSAFVGGVSDSLYAAVAYKYQDAYENIHSAAQKAWFLFDEEIVCLGTNICSANEHTINTTLNQCLLKGEVYINREDRLQALSPGAYRYKDDINWVWHGNVGYYFPNGGDVGLSLQEQQGSWFSINNNLPQDTLQKEVFTLWIDHGIQPENEQYSYILIPGIQQPSEMMNYPVDNIQIVANTNAWQAVYHAGLNILQVICWEAGMFTYKDMSITVDAPCALQLKGIGTGKGQLHVADLSQMRQTIALKIKVPGIAAENFLCTFSSSPHTKGATYCFPLQTD